MWSSFLGLLLFLVSGLTTDGMNIVIPTLAEKNGWDANVMLNFNGVAGWIGVAGCVVLGALTTKIGAKKVILLGLLLCAVSYFTMSLVGNIGMFFVLLSIMHVFANGMSFVAGSALIASWFPIKKGLVMGWSTMGNNMATAVFIPLFMLNLRGGVAMPFAFYAVIMVVLLIIGAIFIRNTPEEYGKAPDNEPMEIEQVQKMQEEMRNHKSSWTIGKLLKDKDVWLMGIAYGLIFMVTVGLVMQFIPRTVSMGYSETEAVTVFSIAAIIGIVASYFWGVIDQLVSTKTASKLLALWFAVAIIFSLLPGRPAFYIFVFFLGCGLGGNTNFAPSMCTNIFGRFDFTKAWTIVYPLESIFRASASIVLGVSLQLSNNSYFVPYIVFLCAAILAFILFFFLNDKRKEGVS